MTRRKTSNIPILRVCLLACMMFLATWSWAQQIEVVGTVVDAAGEEVIGASVTLNGKPGQGTVTDFDGNFRLKANKGDVLTVSYIGMKKQEVKATANHIRVVLENDNASLDEVVVVGYGQQKKVSVVGAITQTSGKVLERSGGVNDLGTALTGNLPGVVTTAGTGMPGEEEPKIVIRGASSWNNSDPLVLVDGIERPMSTVDIASVESISVLKDASATAVYGVKGANGVILITTKRGKEGAAQVNVGFNSTLKCVSKLPGKLDSYDALMARNLAIENELAIHPDSWNYMKPMSFIENYRNQTTQEQRERYPNVDWQDVLFKSAAMSYHANIDVSGGTKFVQYYASADYAHEGDLFETFDNGHGYDSGYAYDRINVRSNLDFRITGTTKLKVNLAGSHGIRQAPWSNASSSEWGIGQQWAGAYNIAPDVFLPQYSDGKWGYYPNASNVSNSAEGMSIGGQMQTTTTRINTDFTLEQDLSFITKGLNAKFTISWDNEFREYERGIKDNSSVLHKWIDPETGIVYSESISGQTKFDPSTTTSWESQGGTMQDSYTTRNLYYQAQLNWARRFGAHDITAMGLFSRQEEARGSVLPIRREDWAFRLTYSLLDRYFLEYNGAYNGSDKFSRDYRFAFFNSGAIGWLVSEEKFWTPLKKYLDMLKIRASYGEIGDDNVGSDRFDSTYRWLYMDQWATGGNALMGTQRTTSSYTWWRQTTVGNNNVHWETVKKLNLGVDYSFLGGFLAGTFELFRDVRDDILVFGSDRQIPAYYGATAPTFNNGKVRTTGYELEVRLKKNFGAWHVWTNFALTHAKNKILRKDDAELMPAYQKAEGYSIGQYTSYLDNGYITNMDQIYGSPQPETSYDQRLVGDYYIIDFNGDGVIDSKDKAPYGYTSTPQNTMNLSLGFEWKDLSFMVQFYGVTGVTRDVNLTSFAGNLDTVYDQGTWWSKNSTDADVTIPRWMSTTHESASGTQYLYDGSYIRLKNAELAYNLHGKALTKIGIKNLRIYINGNNLWLWTRMPDDREVNTGGSGSVGAYPTVKRFNLGVKVSL